MKNHLKASYLVLIAVFLTQCSKEYKLSENLVVQDFVWKGLNAYYLHQDEVADLSDRRFISDQEINAYLSTFTDYNTLFNSLLISSDLKSYLLEDYTNLDIISPRTGSLNGMEFGIIKEPGSAENVIGYVTHILPNSYADQQNIGRGEFFNTVNSVQLTQTNFKDKLFNESQSFNISMVDFDGTNIIPTNKIITLERQNYNYNTVFLEEVFTIDADNIGYLMYHNNFSKSSIDSLNKTFLKFKNQSVNDLILDLRYNIGGGSFVKNMTNLATMITGQFTDEVFIKEQWNSKAQTWFEANQPYSLLTKFPSKLNAFTQFNSLKLKAIYIILNGNHFTGSSAIELLINGLSEYIDVYIIGTNTVGNNTGAITLYNSKDYDFESRNETHTVALQPIVLSFLNSADQTYEDGFTPNIALCPNEDPLNLGILGERTEPVLDRVLEYIISGDKGVNTICNPNNFEFLYNSINAKRVFDTGVFIEQNLPNTN